MQYSTINHNETFTDKGILYKMVTLQLFHKNVPIDGLKGYFFLTVKANLRINCANSVGDQKISVL
jgi:hypothetical protein